MRGFAEGVTHPDNMVMTDQYAAYRNLDRRRESVNHSVGQYVRGMAHVNGIESFWARVNAGCKGIFTKISKRHLQCYLDEFCHRHNRRADSMDTVDMMKLMAAGRSGSVCDTAISSRMSACQAGRDRSPPDGGPRQSCPFRFRPQRDSGSP